MKFLSVRVLYANVPRPLPHMQSGWRRQTMDCPRNAFYLTPLQNWNSTAGSVWFSKQPLGHKKLSTIMSSFCQDARIQGFRTNHSLRATSATHLYPQDADEQLIME